MVKWMKLKEYAEHAGCSYWTIYDLVTAGKLPAYKVGRQWRIDPAEADKVLREGWQDYKDKAERREKRKVSKQYTSKNFDYIAAVKSVKSKWRKAE